MGTPAGDSFISPFGRFLRCLLPQGPRYQAEQPDDDDEPDGSVAFCYDFATSFSHAVNLSVHLSEVAEGSAQMVGLPSSEPARMSRAELEARLEVVRANTPCGHPFTRHKIDFKAGDGLKYCSGKRSLDEAYGLILRAAQQHVDGINRKPLTLQRCAAMGVGEFCKSYVPGMLQRGFEKVWYEDVNVSIQKVFGPDGDADLEMTRTRQQEVHRERIVWLTTGLRTLSLDMSGAVKSNVLLQGVDSIIPSAQTYRADRRTRFHEAAKSWKLPSHEQVRAGVKADSTSTHPELASFRHLAFSSLRTMIHALGAVQYDPSISSASRDKLAHGPRDIINLKDFRHVAQHIPPDLQHLKDKINGCEPKRVYTLFDIVTYMTSLRLYAGSDIIATLPMYTSLSGEFKESCYYCEGVSSEGFAEYFEQIGEGATSGVFHEQKAWNFTDNDVVYIPKHDGSGFGIYDVVKHVRPDLNRQVVMLCINTWVNIPFEVAERLVFAAHGVRLSDMFSEPAPCRNVAVVNGDSKHPILIMNTVKGHERVVYTRYQKETSPRGTATVSPPVLRHLEHLHANGGRNVGLSSREHLNRLQSAMGPVLLGGKVDPHDYTSLLEILRVVGVPDRLPKAVYYNTEDRPNAVFFKPDEYEKENPGESAPTENRAATAVQQVPNIVEHGSTYGTLAADDAALDRAVEAHLGEGNTKERGPHLQAFCTFATKHFLEAMAEHSGVPPGSLEVVTREEVLEKRTRATQRNNEVTWGLGPDGGDELGHGFCKKGEHVKVKDAPRMVNGMEHGLSIDSGRLGQTLDILLKQDRGSHGVNWYCPGLNPSQLSETLRNQYEYSKFMRAEFKGCRIPQVDYRNADDSHTKDSYQLMEDLIRYFFSVDFNTDLGMTHVEWGIKTLKACFNIRIQVGPRVKSTKWKNPSGTGITTHLNSIVFAFRAFQTVLFALFFQQLTGDDGVIQGLPKNDKGEHDPVEGGKADCITKTIWRKQLQKLQSSGVIAKAIPTYECANWAFYKDGDFRTTGLCDVEDVNSTPQTPVMRLLFDLIGVKLGDDGVECSVPGVTDESWLAACQYLDAADGFTRTVTFSDPCEDEKIEFLSREYPNLSETGASYAKIERAAQKLAVSTNADNMKYRDKIIGYMVTDRYTPIIGAYMTAIWNFKQMGTLPDWLPEIDEPAGDLAIPVEYFQRLERDERELARKLVIGPYPVSHGDLDHMYECVGKAYDMTSDELRAFDASLRVQTTWEGIKGHTLPPSLAILTAELSGEETRPALAPGVTMVEAFPKETHLFNAAPDCVRTRPSELLAIMAGKSGPKAK